MKMKLVSLRIALKLKKANCNISSCSGFVHSEGQLGDGWHQCRRETSSRWGGKEYCSRPTYDEVIHHLREKKGIFIGFMSDGEYTNFVVVSKHYKHDDNKLYKSYHACQVQAIKHCIGLLPKR